MSSRSHIKLPKLLQSVQSAKLPLGTENGIDLDSFYSHYCNYAAFVRMTCCVQCSPPTLLNVDQNTYYFNIRYNSWIQWRTEAEADKVCAWKLIKRSIVPRLVALLFAGDSSSVQFMFPWLSVSYSCVMRSCLQNWTQNITMHEVPSARRCKVHMPLTERTFLSLFIIRGRQISR